MTKEDKAALLEYANEHPEIVYELENAARSVALDLQLMNKLMEQIKMAYESYANHVTAMNLTINRLMGEINKTEE